jgi:hypothetical protein
MSSPILIVDTVGSITLYLELSSDGSPATGLTFADITADLRKAGAPAFVSKTLTALNFTELGAGFYELDLSATDTDTLGNMYVRIIGATVDTVLESVFIADETPTSVVTVQSIPSTSLFGFVYRPNGDPLPGVTVSARVLSMPTVLHPDEEALLIGTELTTVSTDSDGFFTISLVTGSEVDLFIPAANYRRTLQVPSSSQNLFSIP